MHWFYGHQTFGVLGVFLTFMCGLFALSELRVQLMPEYVVTHAVVRADWPGVSAEGMDDQVGRHLDRAINAVSGVAEVYTTSYQGGVYIWVELDQNAQAERVLDVIERRISNIPELPDDMDPPVLERPQPSVVAGRMVVYGPMGNKAMLDLSEHINQRLRDAGVSRFNLYGTDEKRWFIEVDPLKAAAHGLDLPVIDQAIRQSLETGPAFQVETNTGQPMIVKVRAPAAHDLRQIDLSAHANGILLGDIAEIAEDDRLPNVRNLFRAEDGFFYEFLRGPDEDALTLTQNLEATVATLRAELPDQVTLQLFDMEVYQIEDRLRLLAQYGGSGLLLVMLSLYIFVGLRAAFWVGIGLISTFSIAFGLMFVTGQTINMVSAFTMVMVIGLLVDDSIVVAESIERYGGKFDGVARTFSPVFVSSLTTIVAFGPIIILQDEIGAYVTAIPAFVCVAIIASLIECYVLLPNHMAKRTVMDRLPTLPGRAGAQERYQAFLAGPFRRALARIWRNPGFALATGVMVLAVSGLLMASQAVPFKLWLNPQSNTVYAHVTLPAGEVPERMDVVFADIWAAADQAAAQFGSGQGDVIRTTFGVAGRHYGSRERRTPEKGSVLVELLDQDGFRLPPDQFVTEWRAAFGTAEEGITVEFGERQLGLRGPQLWVDLRSESLTELRLASQDLVTRLRAINGLQDVRIQTTGQKSEMTIQPLSDVHLLGERPSDIVEDVERALRGLYGTSPRETGRDVRWRVAYQITDDVDGVLQMVDRDTALADLVETAFYRAPDQIRRREGHINNSVTAQIIDDDLSLFDVKTLLREDLLPEITADYDVTVSIDGQVRTQDQLLMQVLIAFGLGLFLIYSTLAIAMRNFAAPLIVLAVIPFGAAGMVFGHFLLGHSVTLLSLVALVGLMGVIVNDSVLLIDEIKHSRSDGQISWLDAVCDGYSVRLRSVLLTSVTTVLGLLPLLTATSYQAQFLIPIAVTISFGLVAATLASLILIPASYSIFAP